MDREEALDALGRFLIPLRELPYSELRRRTADGVIDIHEVVGASGATYQIEIQYFWDGSPKRSVRVLGAVDDGGLRALMPLAGDFIKAPNGRFVGE